MSDILPNPPSEPYLRFETAGRRSLTVMNNLLHIARRHGYSLMLSEAQFRAAGDEALAQTTHNMNVDLQDAIADALELICDLQKSGAAIVEQHAKDLDKLIQTMKGEQ